jgi:hypothetical protein
MAALLERDELDEKVLGIADDLADRFVADLNGAAAPDDEMRLALAGLQLTFLAQVAKLVTGE